jgi:hypothetical protein
MPMGGRGGAMTGGRGGAGGTDCDALIADAAKKLAAAQACSLAQNSSCDGFVDDECGCRVPVDDTTSMETKAYKAAVKELVGCVACTEALCPTSTRASCERKSAGSSQGICQSGLVGTR